MNKILNNKNIVITRAKDQSTDSINTLRELGANVISFPTIDITPVENSNILQKWLSNINVFNTIIFTSENSVKFFILKMKELRYEIDLTKFFIISIGEKTSAFCEQNNFKISFQPKKFSFEDLVNELGRLDLGEKNILIPSSNLVSPEKYKALEKFGAKVTVLPIYQNKISSKADLSEEIKLINQTKIDLYIFTSPSTFNGFLEILNIDDPKGYFGSANIAVIGPVTNNELIKSGIKPNIVPNNYSMDFLIEAIKSYFSNHIYSTESI